LTAGHGSLVSHTCQDHMLAHRTSPLYYPSQAIDTCQMNELLAYHMWLPFN